ncbi:hypothetical protein B0H11DRAFT_576363 [Mycena galericulata]|nr:hypothetical protein B0H11DRAFT_576363 [Mycena galericulata]
MLDVSAVLLSQAVESCKYPLDLRNASKSIFCHLDPVFFFQVNLAGCLQRQNSRLLLASSSQDHTAFIRQALYLPLYHLFAVVARTSTHNNFRLQVERLKDVLKDAIPAHMSDSRLYSRLLLPKGHGYPLFHPQPFDDLPLESRRTGTEIGDVGIVTSDGSFDVLFNICRTADDPMNRFGVPGDFEQIPLGPGDIAPRAQYHRPGSHVSNTQIRKRRLDVNADVENNVFVPMGVGAVVEISTASSEAAFLLLPDGASRTDLRRLKRFRDYAMKHAKRWYEFVNGDLERMVESGDLYLVTGVDKTASWSLAAIENRSEGCGISLKLKASQAVSAGTSCAWEWDVASSFADSGPRRLLGEESWQENQTVFLRGYKVAIRARPLHKSSKVLSIVDSKPSDILSKGGFAPFSQVRSDGLSRLSRTSTVFGRASAPRDAISKPYHPADIINAHLLASYPDAPVAVTHDKEWASVISEDEGIIPDVQLIDRIFDKYNVEITSDGVSLQYLDSTGTHEDRSDVKMISEPSLDYEGYDDIALQCGTISIG